MLGGQDDALVVPVIIMEIIMVIVTVVILMVIIYLGVAWWQSVPRAP